MDMGSVLDVQAGRDSDKIALICGAERVTYGQLLERVCRVASGLRALGVGVGQHVLLALDDGVPLVSAFLGCARAGIVPVPVNPLAPAELLDYMLRDSAAVALITGDEAAAALPEGSVPLEIGAGPGRLSFDALLDAGEPYVDPHPAHPDDIAFILYSSGSTGRPKGVVHLRSHIPVVYQGYGRQILGVRRDDVLFSTSKLYHAYGVCNSIAYPYWGGATAVVMPGHRDLRAIFDVIERERPTLFFSIPGLFNAMLRMPGARDRDLSSVRLCLSAAEPLPPDVLHRWKDTFGLDILDGIGSTEMLGIFCSNTPDDIRPGTCGRPVPGYRLKLLDEQGEEVVGEGSGTLHVDGGSALAGYWRRHERTKDTINGRWVATNDRFHRDAEGYYRYLGRADDMMKINGRWISPIEVEEILLAHESVADAAVVGVPHEGFTKIKAFVVPGAEADTEALARELPQWCASRLDRHQYPRFIEFVDALPKTPTGKNQRYLLREAR